MPIERRVKKIPSKRQKSELIQKNERIGKLLGLEKVPTHTLSWKEPHLELETADCYPMVDVLECIAQILNVIVAAKKPVKPKKG